MYNCWNEALEYLIKKCGEKSTPINSNFRNGKSTVQYAKTYNTSNVKEEDQVIVRLMGQYYYGIQAKKDLYEVLISRGVSIN